MVWEHFYWLSNDHPLDETDLHSLPKQAARRYIGCHLGWEDLGKQSPAEIRRMIFNSSEALHHLGLARPVLGLSTHTAEHIEQVTVSSRFAPIDYIGFGPFRPTVTKNNTWPVTGERGLVRTLETTKKKLPVAVIGGLKPADGPLLQRLALEAGRDAGEVIPAMISGLLADLKAQ